jgi:hypothetical protein
MDRSLVWDVLASAAAAPGAGPEWFDRAAAAAVPDDAPLLAACEAGLARAPVTCTWLGKKKVGREQVVRWVAWVLDELVPLGLAAANTAPAPAAPTAAAATNNRFGRNTLLPPVPLLELDAHLRDRDLMTGPTVCGGLFSVADAVCYAACRQFAPALALARLPHIVRWCNGLEASPRLAALFLSGSAPLALGATRVARGEPSDLVAFSLRLEYRRPAEAAPGAALVQNGNSARAQRTKHLPEVLASLAAVDTPYDPLEPATLAVWPADLDPAAGDLDPGMYIGFIQSYPPH